ncbi:hypothetical protein Gotri_016090 [Gossypium trilobum]|uniref:RNase H type-1 domain-containing protein n=1 Tax=Gossypium trilobum TaxID=34281 RepID=A0A7J9E311_9ROSI|nr:hypothetical protein [Gossypium trilobum]
MGLFVTITFHHVRRDANEAAHVLAREERRLSEEWLWIEEAPELVERVAAVDWSKYYNNEAQELMCIGVIGASNRRYAHIGDVIVVMIKEAVPNTPLEKAEVIRAVIVCTRKELKRDNRMII